jgi:membrane protease YdiL (CAAX protease family)
MGKPRKKHAETAEQGPAPLRSLFAGWTPGCFKQVILAGVGLLMLGMVCWIVFFDAPPDPETAPAWKLRDVVLVFLAWLGLAGLEDLGWRITCHEVHARTGRPVRALTANFVLLAANQLAILVAVDVFGLRTHGLNWVHFGFHRISFGWVFGSIGLGLGTIVASTIVVVVLNQWARQEVSMEQANFLLPPDEGPPAASEPAATPEPAAAIPPPRGRSFLWGAIGMVLLAGLATPFCEEILFRGVLYSWLAERLDWTLAAVLSAILFGAGHFRFGKMVAIAAAVGGVVLAAAYHYSGSLWPPVIIHTVVNAPKIVFLYVLRARGIRLA